MQECFSENESVEDLAEREYYTSHHNKTHSMFLRSFRLQVIKEEIVKTNDEECDTESLQNRRNVDQSGRLGMIVDLSPDPGNQIQNGIREKSKSDP